jgi:hypothetical protein
MIDEQTLKEAIKRELPGWFREDPALRAFILELTRREYADRVDTQDRFYEILAELRRDREEQARLWAVQTRLWDEQKAQDKAKWDEQTRLWDEQKAQDKAKWDEQKAEDKRRWEENRADFKRVHEEIMLQASRFDRSIGALGARWGLRSERAFRDALAGILEKSFDVEVRNVTEWDEQGEVFGRPDQIELDVIIKNGLLIICELKSSIDKAGMYIFERKARYYERRHDRRADRLIVISPMIDARALAVAERLGIDTYGDSTEVQAL